MSRASQTPSTPSNASPRFTAISPASQPKQIASSASFVPQDRSLPDRDVNDDTIDDAYAAFILYCNPSFSADMDTTELTKLFRIPPKSDGNAFSTWRLFELIRKLDCKEIPTWTQLALDLGVEKPDFDKGQSTQKVQQYSVRLKVRDSSVLERFRIHFPFSSNPSWQDSHVESDRRCMNWCWGRGERGKCSATNCWSHCRPLRHHLPYFLRPIPNDRFPKLDLFSESGSM
jgi:hypothetical protein